MTRIVEILIAVNAVAGIAAFLGLRRLFRKWPRKKQVEQSNVVSIEKHRNEDPGPA